MERLRRHGAAGARQAGPGDDALRSVMGGPPVAPVLERVDALLEEASLVHERGRVDNQFDAGRDLVLAAAAVARTPAAGA